MNPNHDEEPDQSRLERQEKKCQELIHLIEQFLEFQRWNFQRTYVRISAELPAAVIYDSEWCRVKFALSGDIDRDYEMAISYGRLHAQNEATIMRWDENVMLWNGEKCFCWHRVEAALNFLEGLSPRDAVDYVDSHGHWPRMIVEFQKSEVGNKISNQPEHLIRIHAAIWEHHGHHLFELFDLRRPDLWERYKQFVSEYHKIKGSEALPGYPAWEKIC